MMPHYGYVLAKVKKSAAVRKINCFMYLVNTCLFIIFSHFNLKPAGNYMFKVNNKNSRTR